MSRIPALVFCMLLAISSTAESQELPTTLMCTSNAKASRDYGFLEKRWTGQKGHLVEVDDPFQIGTRDTKVANIFFELRDKVFAGLNTDKPVVRSITRFKDGTEEVVEFVASVVTRSSDLVFLVWKNDFNKVWVAAVDLTHRRAALTHVFQGVTSVGGELETLDCR